MIVQALEAEDGAVMVAELFEQHSGHIFAYLFRLTSSRETAEELTQETYLRLFKARHQLPHVQNRRAWLYRIASNLAFDALRRRKFAWLPWLQADEWGLRKPDVAEASGEREAVAHALEAVPPDYRAPLLLFTVYGLPVSEIAEALHLSEGAVKTRLRRARQMFRKAYGSEDDANGRTR